MVSQAWNASILDRYEFRQVQTALSAFWVIQDGFRLDYLTPIFGPPWSIPMEFPIYQWSIAALVGLTHMPLEQAGRLLSVLFFVATLPAVYDLLALAGLSASRRLLALALILSAPVYLFYTRTVMIETMIKVRRKTAPTAAASAIVSLAMYGLRYGNMIGWK